MHLFAERCLAWQDHLIFVIDTAKPMSSESILKLNGTWQI